MKRVEWRIILSIDDAFNRHYIAHKLIESDRRGMIHAGLAVPGLKDVIAEFYVRSNGDGTCCLAVRIYGLVPGTPEEKRFRVLEACNAINEKVRYLRFCLDDDGDVNVKCDLIADEDSERIGEMTATMFKRMTTIIGDQYHVFMKAISTDEKIEIRYHGVSQELIDEYLKDRRREESTPDTSGKNGE